MNRIHSQYNICCSSILYNRTTTTIATNQQQQAQDNTATTLKCILGTNTQFAEIIRCWPAAACLKTKISTKSQKRTKKTKTKENKNFE